VVNTIIVKKYSPDIVVKKSSGLSLNRITQTIVVKTIISARIMDESFTATDGQTVFTLTKVTPKKIICVFVNGVSQSLAKGDYSVLGKIITLSSGVGLGDAVTAVYQY
jgi:hypothetical protein